MTAVPEPSDAAGPIQHLGGLGELEALRIENRRLQARAKFAADQCVAAWAETRRAIRERDQALGEECPLTSSHASETGCPRCGTNPDGSVR